MKEKVLQRLGLIVLIAIAGVSFAVPSDWFGDTKLGQYLTTKKILAYNLSFFLVKLKFTTLLDSKI